MTAFIPISEKIQIAHLSHFKKMKEALHLKNFDFKGTIHLYCLNLFRHDGVSNHCFEMATFWSELGIKVKLYSFGASDADRSFISKQEDLKKNFDTNQDILFFMFSIGDPFLNELSAWNVKKVIFFQGITPPDLVSEIGHQVAEDCKYGLTQLPLVTQFDLIGTSSLYNFGSLKEANPDFSFTDRKMFFAPPFVSMDKMKHIQATEPSGKSNRPFLLYVGRLFPNKNVHQIVELYAEIKKLSSIELDLYLVGSGSLPHYKDRILNTIHTSLGSSADSVKMIESVTDTDLVWYYQNAEALVHLSKHEGFGLTLVEAMRCETPVITHDFTAIKETLKGSGIYINALHLDQSAKELILILNDSKKMKEIAEKQTKIYQQHYSDSVLIPSYYQITERMIQLAKSS